MGQAPTDDEPEDAEPGSQSFAERLAGLAPPTRARPVTSRFAKPTSELIGRRAIDIGYCGAKQVLDALRFQYRAKMVLGREILLGEVLWLQGAINASQLEDLVERKSGSETSYTEKARKVSDRFFGDVAMQLGHCSAEQVLEALDEERDDLRNDRPLRRIREILFESGHLNEGQLKQVVDCFLDYGDTRRVPYGETTQRVGGIARDDQGRVIPEGETDAGAES